MRLVHLRELLSPECPVVTNLLDRYAIDARIFENYSSRSVRNDYHLAVPGVVRLVGAQHASRNLMTNTRLEAGGKGGKG